MRLVCHIAPAQVMRICSAGLHSFSIPKLLDASNLCSYCLWFVLCKHPEADWRGLVNLFVIAHFAKTGVNPVGCEILRNALSNYNQLSICCGQRSVRPMTFIPVEQKCAIEACCCVLN